MYRKMLLFTIISFVFSMKSLMAQKSWHKLTSYSQANSFNWMKKGKDNIIYGVTPDRWVYYSEDNGESWSSFVDVPSFHNISLLEASKVSNRVFAKSLSDGIIYTDDYGANWTGNDLGLSGGNSGFGPPILAIGLKGNKVALGLVDSTIKLFVSSNNGVNFNEVGDIPFSPKGFHFLTSDKVFSNTTNYTGLFFSSDIDAGNNWQQIAFNGKHVSDVFIHGDSIFASVYGNTGDGHVHISTDEGQTWSQVGGSVSNEYIDQLTYDSENERLFVTSNEGIHYFDGTDWIHHHAEPRTHPIVITDNQTVVFSGPRYRGVKTVNPTDLSVEVKSEGLRLSTDFMELTNDDKIFVASVHKANLSIYDINQQSWSYKTLFDSIHDTRITAIDLTTDGHPVIGGLHYIAKRFDTQDSLQVIADDNTAPLAPVYNILSPNKMFVGKDDGISMVQHASQNYVDYTPDMGNSWSVLYDANVHTPALFNIEKVCTGTTNHYIYGQTMAVENVVLHSDDDGNSWTQLPAIPNSAIIENIFVDNNNKLFAVASSGIFEWNDAQNDWIQHPVQFTGSNRRIEMAFDENNNIHILVRTTFSPFPEEGIHISYDGGQSYEHNLFPTINGELVRFKSMKFATGNVPIAFTEEKSHDSSLDGIYYLHEEAVLSSQNEKQPEQEVNLYPNPASNEVRIKTDENINTTAQLLALTGKKSFVVVENSKIDLSDYASGAYILRFTYKGKHFSYKLIVKK
ncbi:MAG: T9SS type A sorting domain-containing protein [Brumimicrobium sp.]